jgi:hypothetical protein
MRKTPFELSKATRYVRPLASFLRSACADYQDTVFKNLPCKRIQCDEIWSFNFCRIHKSLRVTPAMEAGVTDHVWSIEELVGLLDQSEVKAA